MKKTILITLCLLGLSVINCKKGDTGPQGPKGDTGAAGSNNIKSTQVSVETWQLGCQSTCLYSDYAAADITQAVIDKGAVLAYMQSGSNWVQLPFITGDYEFYYTFTAGKITFNLRSASGTTAISGPTGATVYKYVSMPAVAKGGTSNMSAIETN